MSTHGSIRGGVWYMGPYTVHMLDGFIAEVTSIKSHLIILIIVFSHCYSTGRPSHTSIASNGTVKIILFSIGAYALENTRESNPYKALLCSTYECSCLVCNINSSHLKQLLRMFSYPDQEALLCFAHTLIQIYSF